MFYYTYSFPVVNIMYFTCFKMYTTNLAHYQHTLSNLSDERCIT